MSPKDRIQKLENAFNTLVELAQRADGKLNSHEERLDGYEERFVRIEDSIERVVGLVGAIASAQAQTEVKVAQLAEAQKHMDEKIVELSEHLADTDDKLNAFIVTVEKYIENRNGQS
jgi:chromosome segregation ATPase